MGWQPHKAMEILAILEMKQLHRHLLWHTAMILRYSVVENCQQFTRLVKTGLVERKGLNT